MCLLRYNLKSEGEKSNNPGFSTFPLSLVHFSLNTLTSWSLWTNLVCISLSGTELLLPANPEPTITHVFVFQALGKLVPILKTHISRATECMCIFGFFGVPPPSSMLEFQLHKSTGIVVVLTPALFGNQGQGLLHSRTKEDLLKKPRGPPELLWFYGMVC